MNDAVIVSVARTPIGKAYRGAFNDTEAPVLGGHVVRAAVARAGIDPGEVDDVLVGVSVPATSANLGPGYDAFGVALDVPLVAVAGPRGDERVRTEGEGAVDVPTGDDNLVWQALLRCLGAFTVSSHGDGLWAYTVRPMATHWHRPVRLVLLETLDKWDWHHPHARRHRDFVASLRARTGY